MKRRNESDPISRAFTFGSEKRFNLATGFLERVKKLQRPFSLPLSLGQRLGTHQTMKKGIEDEEGNSARGKKPWEKPWKRNDS